MQGKKIAYMNVRVTFTARHSQNHKKYKKSKKVLEGDVTSPFILWSANKIRQKTNTKKSRDA